MIFWSEMVMRFRDGRIPVRAAALVRCKMDVRGLLAEAALGGVRGEAVEEEQSRQ